MDEKFAQKILDNMRYQYTDYPDGHDGKFRIDDFVELHWDTPWSSDHTYGFITWHDDYCVPYIIISENGRDKSIGFENVGDFSISKVELNEKIYKAMNNFHFEDLLEDNEEWKEFVKNREKNKWTTKKKQRGLTKII